VKKKILYLVQQDAVFQIIVPSKARYNMLKIGELNIKSGVRLWQRRQNTKRCIADVQSLFFHREDKTGSKPWCKLKIILISKISFKKS
jgi:hypothetical protein